MYSREELADVYPDVAPNPLLSLIDLVLTALEAPDSAVLDSFRKRQAYEGGRAGKLCPADLLDELILLIHPDFPTRPIQWHLQRAGHVLSCSLEPRLEQGVQRVLHDHRRFLGEVAGSEPEAFLYVGLRVLRPGPTVQEHLRTWAGRDVEVARFIIRSGKLVESALGEDVLGLAASAAFAELGEDRASTRGSPPPPVLATSGGAAELLPWFAWLRRQYPAALAQVHGLSLPPPKPDAPLTSPGEGAEGRRPRKTLFDPLFDAEEPRPTGSLEVVAQLVIAITRTYPYAGPALAEALGVVWRRGRPGAAAPLAPPADETVVELAKLGPPFLRTAVELGWTDPLRGATELLDVAAMMVNDEERSSALSAIGRPAGTRLGATVDELLTKLAAEPEGRADGHGQQLVKLADQADCLGLPFWEKRLTRPQAFGWLWRSDRLREAFTLHPDPVYRLVRRAAEREPLVAVEALRVLLPSLPAFSVAPVAAEVVALLGSEDRGVPWTDRARLLAHAGTAAAHEALVRILSEEGRSETELLRTVAQDPVMWTLLANADPRFDGQRLAAALEVCETPLCALAAVAVADTIVTQSLDRPDAQSGRHPGRTNTEVLVALVRDHRVALGPERVDRALQALTRVLEPDVWRALHTRGAAPDDRFTVPPLPWTHLFDADLGHLLADVGRWFAERISDPPWMRYDLGKVLRPAIIARYRDALGEHGDKLLARLGDRWPTQAAVVSAAEELGITLEPAALARCADEAVPPIFRAALTRLPLCIEASDASQWADEHWVVRWVFESVWLDAPELLARHIATVLEGASGATWRRGLALALVALREPCGTTVPDVLTHAARVAASEEERAFLKRQRDTFARGSATREREIPGEVRNREALHRLQRYAKLARGVR